jgi:hypothetical protein
MESVIKDSNAIMKMEEDRNTGDDDATVDSDAKLSPYPMTPGLMRIRF